MFVGSRSRKWISEWGSIAQDWRSRGFSCGLWVDPPGQVWEDYMHTTEELLMVLEGESELEMQGRVFRPKVGEEGWGNHGPVAVWVQGKLRRQSSAGIQVLAEGI